jgi:hypothetical protein
MRRPCADCGHPCAGTRCRPCSTRLARAMGSPCSQPAVWRSPWRADEFGVLVRQISAEPIDTDEPDRAA